MAFSSPSEFPAFPERRSLRTDVIKALGALTFCVVVVVILQVRSRSDEAKLCGHICRREGCQQDGSRGSLTWDAIFFADHAY